MYYTILCFKRRQLRPGRINTRIPNTFVRRRLNRNDSTDSSTLAWFLPSSFRAQITITTAYKTQRTKIVFFVLSKGVEIIRTSIGFRRSAFNIAVHDRVVSPPDGNRNRRTWEKRIIMTTLQFRVSIRLISKLIPRGSP